MRKITFTLGAAALLSLGAITAPAHAEYGERYPHRVIVVPAPPPPPQVYYGQPYYGQPQQRWHGDDRWDSRRRGWGTTTATAYRTVMTAIATVTACPIATTAARTTPIATR